MRNVLSGIILVLFAVAPLRADDRPAVVEAYADLVHRTYAAAHADAVDLREHIEAFTADPSEATFADAREAWLRSRETYGLTEAFRFYGGPIDGIDPTTGDEGPEGLLNAWPLNEAYIDYVRGDDDAGIIMDPTIDITRELLVEANQGLDEADVTTGYHAIEFLLWGQDFNDAGPGTRPFTDYTDHPFAERRKAYLLECAMLIEDQLAALTEAWAPDRSDNAAALFIARPTDEALSDIITGVVTLAGFELASERLAVSLDSGEQEDEHSCFSDNTHRDYVANAAAIQNVYFAEFDGASGPSVHDLLAAEDPALANALAAQVQQAVELAEGIEPPIDLILITPVGSPEREPMEALVESLYQQAELWLLASEKLGLSAAIQNE